VSRRYFEPFGAHVGFDGTPTATLTHDIRHGFTGHPHDDDLGLIDMRGRVYSPSTRQFLTPDPLGRLGASPYSYVRNNPLNWIDPTGFTEEDPGRAWFSNFDTLFGVVPNAAIDMSQTLVLQLASAVAAMDFPNGNDAPNSSGCPDGTGTAPRPCAAPGEAGCSPGAGLEGSYARYIMPMPLTLDLPRPPGMTVEPRSFEEEALEDDYYALLFELRASAATAELIAEVHAIRTDPAKKEAFAEAVWGGMVTKYEMAKLGLAADLLLQGSLGTLGVLVRGVGAARGGARVTLASGTGAADDGLNLVRTLERGEKWAAVQDEMRYLQWATKQEHYLISFKDGSVRLFSGGRYSTTFEFTSEMRRVLMHTHPKVTGPSGADFATLGAIGQRSSWLLEPGMPLQRFRVP
jgi:RHS repeat-associated protein